MFCKRSPHLEPQNLALIMPVDMAVQLYITHSPPLHSFLSSYEDYRARNLVNVHYRPLRPCINTKNARNAQNLHPTPPCHSRKGPETRAKKKVVFADSKGMSLTAVRVFCSSDKKSSRSESPLQFYLPKLEDGVNAAQTRVLDFPQPALDYLSFRRRLMKNSVCLECCLMQGRALTGTVKVRNLAFEKSVHLRITCDSWRSHRDVVCTYVNDVYGCRDSDTFSFAVEIPSSVSPQEKVEFCFRFTTVGQTYWDNNDGKNYAAVVMKDNKKRIKSEVFF
ncbi:protein phosphatase 1, regulatory subunit 3Ca [Trichomycterus rosablanca]|uniref:protein phosphatase 1, regulatory subunit 3Ca n=1 Tax=Trichomycterus rosablanca TaxID=2290929 RepID=UPI002F35A4F1